ncbi:MAG: RNA chaperone Hfq [Gammaproteobacteria bacterium]|nr:RNA chaperone Hfq [Gammaproteobacteria bacterium]
MIYKHAISTIVPSRAVRIPYDTPGYADEDDVDQSDIGQNDIGQN